MKKITTLLLVFTMLPGVAGAHTPEAIPDPPNTMQFKTTTLKNVNFKSVEVPPGCDENYRGIVEAASQKIWQECTAIGKSEPSDCQRSLFQHCTDSANRLRALQPSTCQVMISEAGKIGAATKAHETQASSQESNAELNKKAADASNTIAGKLEGDAKTVDSLLSDAKKRIAGGLCAANTSTPDYLKVEAGISDALKGAHGELASLASQKRLEAKGYAGTATESEKNQIAMNSAKANNLALAGADSGSGGSSRKKTALTAAAIGLPAAALLGVLASSNSANSVGNVDPSGEGAGPITAPDGNFTNIDGLYIDPSFTDRQKATIVEAYRKMPECYKPRLKNIAIVNKALPRKSRSQCVAGQWSAGAGGRQQISLSPSCYGITVSTTIHEFMHSIGFRNGHRMHNQFEPIRRKHSCYVSSYAQTNVIEDFAETGLQAIFPNNTGRSSGPCVGEKVNATRELLKTCQ